jgi:prevent-host-death family protein
MTIEINYTAMRKKLSGLLNRVTDDQEVVIIRRRGGRDVAIISADELSRLMKDSSKLLGPKSANTPQTACPFAATLNAPMRPSSTGISTQPEKRSV